MSTDLLRIEGLLRDARVILKHLESGEIQVRMRTAAGDDWVDMTRNEISRHTRMVVICADLLKNQGYVHGRTSSRSSTRSRKPAADLLRSGPLLMERTVVFLGPVETLHLLQSHKGGNDAYA